MTVVVVKKYGKKIVMCADSQTSCGDNKNLESNKIIKKDNVMIGFAGLVKVKSLLIIFLRTRKLDECENEEDILTFLVDFFDWMKKKDSDSKLDCHLLICVKNKIFVCKGLGITEANGFAAIGSGVFLALGALACNAAPKKAVEIACKYDLYCSGEVKQFEIGG